MLLPPALRARRVAIWLSIAAVVFALPAGYCARAAYARRAAPDDALPWLFAFLVLLLASMLLRMGAAVAELFWLERTWSNIPEPRRNVGPVRDVSSGMAIAISIVPGVAWVWKLGIVIGIADGFRHLAPAARIPKGLGIAAVVVGWVPGLNVYVAPFLWEVFARRIDHAAKAVMATSAGPT